MTCFAQKGFYGTTTHDIADRAGISQPYLYRLFANKQALYAAAVGYVSDLMATMLTTHVAEATPSSRSAAQAMSAARAAYGALIEDRRLLMFLMHANCAANEPLVVDAVRACYAKQVELVRNLVGCDDDAIRCWFGAGMLDNVVIALDLAAVDEAWARTLADT